VDFFATFQNEHRSLATLCDELSVMSAELEFLGISPPGSSLHDAFRAIDGRKPVL
jgi:hypothetical protein